MSGRSNKEGQNQENRKKVDNMGKVRYFRSKPRTIRVLVVDKTDPDQFVRFIGEPNTWDHNDNVGFVPHVMGYYNVEDGNVVVKHNDGSFSVFSDIESLELDYQEVSDYVGYR